MRLLTQHQAAEVMRCSVHKIARLRRDHGLPWIKGRPVLIPETEFLTWLESQTIRQVSAPVDLNKTPKVIGKYGSPNKTEAPMRVAGAVHIKPSVSHAARRITLMRKRS